MGGSSGSLTLPIEQESGDNLTVIYYWLAENRAVLYRHWAQEGLTDDETADHRGSEHRCGQEHTG